MQGGFRAVRPLEWRRFASGVYARLEGQDDRAQFFYRAADATRDELLRDVLEDVGLTGARFEPPLDLQAGVLDWRVTPFDFRAGYRHIRGAVATAETAQGCFLVYFQGSPHEYEQLHEQLLLPVLEVFEVLEG